MVTKKLKLNCAKFVVAVLCVWIIGCEGSGSSLVEFSKLDRARIENLKWVLRAIQEAREQNAQIGSLQDLEKYWLEDDPFREGGLRENIELEVGTNGIFIQEKCIPEAAKAPSKDRFSSSLLRLQPDGAIEFFEAEDAKGAN